MSWCLRNTRCTGYPMPRGAGIGKIMLSFDPLQYEATKGHALSYSEPLASYLRGMLNEYLAGLGHLEVFPERELEEPTFEDDPEAKIRRLSMEATEAFYTGAEERRIAQMRYLRTMSQHNPTPAPGDEE